MDANSAENLANILLPGKYDGSPNKDRSLLNVQF